MLQSSELSFNGSAASVQILEPLSVAGDAREESPAQSERQGWLVGLRAPERDHGFAAARLTLVVDTDGVVALIHGARPGLVAASVERVEKRGDEFRFVVPKIGSHLQIRIFRERAPNLDTPQVR